MRARHSDAALATAVYFTSTLGSWNFDFQVWQFADFAWQTSIKKRAWKAKRIDSYCHYTWRKDRKEQRERRSMHGQSLYWTAKSSFIFLTSDHTEAENLGPKLHPGGFFGPWFFIILKNLHQDLSNEGSNFILSSLEVAQTWPFFDKLPEITGFGLGYCQCQNWPSSYLWHA